jgi:hypothetical protein
MGRILIGIVIGAVALVAWQRVQHPQPLPPTGQPSADPGLVEQQGVAMTHESFSCDGRVHCSEMKSCEEADFFAQNCPGVKMDGDRDGKACEDRCGH